MYSIDDRRYWDRKAEQDKANAKAAVEYAQSPTGKRDILRKKIDGLRLDEVDNGVDHKGEIATLQGQLQAIKDEPVPASTTWTHEQTVERRAAWNAWVKANRPNALQVRTQEQAQGYTVDDLKAAIKAHNL
ncbi:MAG: hypothetical protein KJ556_20920 [Gammaproteobacteria bacterium]|nr:hypothetical protein [Gammaproteobacteria bacterium]